MRSPNQVATFMGWVFMACAMAGALVPGLNFHVNLAGDTGQLEWHTEMAKKMKARIERAASQPQGDK